MPGLSFLHKKGFHPARSSNQKRVFVAEQSVADRIRAEEERAQQILKESEELTISSLQDHHSSKSKDPRRSSLNFMYNQPKSEKKNGGQNVQQPEIYLGNRDDDMVRAFREKISNATNSSRTLDAKDDLVKSDYEEKDEGDATDNATEEARLRKLKAGTNFGASAHRSKLEIETGKRRKVGLTQEEQAERFSFLKNAPVEGAFAKNIEIRHKPFNEIVRNVQCVRCGEWGHQSNDRECPLRDANPHEFARKKREDPLTYMQSDDFLLEKQKMVLRFAAADREKPFVDTVVGAVNNSRNDKSNNSSSSSSGGPSSSESVNFTAMSAVSIKHAQEDRQSMRNSHEKPTASSSAKIGNMPSRANEKTSTSTSATTISPSTRSILPEEGDDDSDPERDFIATLTSREKKLLLRKLRALETPHVSKPHSSDGDKKNQTDDHKDDTSNSDSSDSEDD